MNKKAWIKIVEAFVAVLILIGIILLVVSKASPNRYDLSSRIYDTEISILRGIEHDAGLRNDIVAYSGTLPLEWEDFDSNGLGSVKNKIISRTPVYLECVAKLCSFDDPCNMDNFEEETVYAQSVGIFAEGGSYSPKQLKLFCWTK